MLNEINFSQLNPCILNSLLVQMITTYSESLACSNGFMLNEAIAFLDESM